ncbi:hypothetical protein Gorai_006374 [Gossypium raimondii]|uniref:J domain-containing protein n=1 Tax=Gossypium raimondii TaxID=29730 RepID=A0A7J8QFZ3_GOSRA|nr:hypothetical protein [Gossypium raimondii]
MARGKNGKKRGSEAGHQVTDAKGRGKTSEVKDFSGDKLPNGNPSKENVTKGHRAGTENKYRQNSEKFVSTEKHGDSAEDLGQSISSGSNSGSCTENKPSKEASSGREQNEISPDGNLNLKHKNGSWGCLLNGFHLKNAMDNVDFSDTAAVRNARAIAVSTFKYLLSNCHGWDDEVSSGVGKHLFCVINVFPKAIAALTAVFVGLTVAMLVVAVFGTIFLWFYGSFWTTLMVIFLGGLAFSFSHERLALLVATIYSVYCAWMYAGWLGLLLALNLSFISSDALIYYLKNHINQQAAPDGNPEQTDGMYGHSGFFNDESVHGSFSENVPGFSANHGPGVASTSGVDTVMTSEDEVARLLNCSDHYSALGLSRYQNVDVNVLKREYRKKAMLVHPDKNMGNEKAAEAFKKLQNAYERKTYDDELRREELLNYFRRFQNASQKNGRHGFFPSRSARSEADGEEPFGESRRIACKKCGNFHVWAHTKKSKSRARWCQECKDFHQAKDGDGWVEQSSEPLFFGFLLKVEAPSAYVCADSKIYDATEWYICQGMRCPPNTHKPSFHVNTSVTSKHATGKGSSSGQRGGTMPTPPNLEETMTEEEFLAWLQNAVQGGMFDNFNGSSTSAENPSTKAESSSKSSSSGSGSKRKKKGKKQW